MKLKFEKVKNEFDQVFCYRAGIYRGNDGISRRVDRTKRLKALGNAIVPQVAYQLFKCLDEINNQLDPSK